MTKMNPAELHIFKTACKNLKIEKNPNDFACTIRTYDDRNAWLFRSSKDKLIVSASLFEWGWYYRYGGKSSSFFFHSVSNV